MLQLLIGHLLAALIAPALFARWGRRVFLAIALVPAAAAVWAAAQTPTILRGEAIEVSVTWVSALDMHLDFRLDGLAWLMTLLVGGVGALVLAYCAAYFSPSAKGMGRFGAVFIAFAGAMLGLITADNTVLMYVFWELTSVASFLLIGHYYDRQSSRGAAGQAFIVTTLGGLAMLAGIIALGEMPGGSYLLSELVASPPSGGIVPVAIVLVLLGALSKSALLPFHFWLPAAMAAPTPVSAYLHAAAMVKAGVYLVARLAPGFSDLPVWRWYVVVVGAATMIVGGYRALRQHDLKLLLAFGTVSQLGMLVMLVGFGTQAVALAGITLVAAHALFKACLFLTVGVIDWSVGTRDLRELSGLGRRMPVMAVSAGVATASMVGLPPFLGFLGKEAALVALTEDTSAMAVLIALVVGAIITFAYGMRFMWGAFGNLDGVEAPPTQRTSRLIAAPVVFLAAVGLVLGVMPVITERLLLPLVSQFDGEPGHLTLWDGIGLPLILTLAIIAVGLLAFAARDRIEELQDRVGATASAEGGYRRIIRSLEHFAADSTAFTQRGSLPAYLSTIVVAVCALGGGAALAFTTAPARVRLWDNVAQVSVVIVVCVAALLAARARRRLKAVILMGVVGYGVALIYEIHGAPDLALTQVLVETITLVVFVLVLRRLPAFFSNRPLPTSRWWRVVLGVVGGLTFAGLTFVIAGSRVHEPVSTDFPREALEFGYGRNIVNVTLVDIRAWDTLGEISVVLAAATGIASLVFLRARSGRIDRASTFDPSTTGSPVWPSQAPVVPTLEEHAGARPEDLRAPGRGRQWLSAVPTLAPQRRSLIFEIGTRLVFHTMIVFSIYLLFAGHNQPGGGFAGGLLAGIALTVRYLAGGRYELGEAAPVQAGFILGAGLFLAGGVGAAAMLLGGEVLQSAVIDLDLGPFGEVHLVTTLFFDIGVYLVVVGLVLDILRTLGVEVDRQAELTGEASPDVAYDFPEHLADDELALPAAERPGGSGEGSAP
ncbi:MAG TPA: Na+/H+ antiporter subunit A [Actinomycetaceae bacterium]|nr:Na+/H+ antiporter subunit A [Actinomycetaceae bacterium]